MQKEQTEIKNDKQAKPEIIEPTFDNWDQLINDIVKNTENETSPNSAYDGGGFTIFQIVKDDTITSFFPNRLTQNQIDNIKKKKNLLVFSRATLCHWYDKNIKLNTKDQNNRKLLMTKCKYVAETLQIVLMHRSKKQNKIQLYLNQIAYPNL